MNWKIAIIKAMKWKNLDKRWIKDLRFRKAWREREPEYQLARNIIKARLKKGMTQAQLAKKVGTKQPVISRLESMHASPSLRFLKRIAKALNTKLQIQFT